MEDHVEYYQETKIPDLTGKTKEQLEQMIRDHYTEIDMLTRSLKEAQLTLDIKAREAERAMGVIKLFMDTGAMAQLILERR